MYSIVFVSGDGVNAVLVSVSTVIRIVSFFCMNNVALFPLFSHEGENYSVTLHLIVQISGHNQQVF